MQDNMNDMVRKGRHKKQVGELNDAAKLSEKEVVEIIERIQGGENNKQIAKDYPVSHALISRIRLGKAWGELAKSIGYVPKEKYSSIRSAA